MFAIRIVLCAATALLLLDLGPSRACAQGLPRLFTAGWMGFDTGAFPDAFGPDSLAVGDLDGDGDVDVLVGQSYYGGPGVSVLRNLGNGTYGQPEHQSLPRDKTVGKVALADVDGDGDLDAFATIPDSFGLTAEVGLWRNNGDATLAAVERFAAGPGPIGMVVADFNGDGHPDVVTADFGYIGQGTTVSLLRHNGLAGAAAGLLAPQPFTVGSSPLAVAAGDIDGDGRIDLAVARGDATGATLEVLRNDGAGGFLPPVSYPLSSSGSQVVALVDLDNDGDRDLINSDGGGSGSVSYGVIEIRRNPGNGAFGPAERHALDDWSSPAADLAFADLDRDGWPDIVSANPSGRSFEGWRVLRNDGAGGFQTPASAYPSSQNTDALAAADLDGDGDLDVVTVAHHSAAITVHTNPGNGAFPRPPTYSVDTLTEGMDAANLDGDGDLDLVTSADAVRVLHNQGDGTFPPASAFQPPLNPADIRLRDLNGDGYPDLLLGPDAEFPPYNFATALNRGDGTFLPGRVWPIDACGDGHIDAFDLDRDGDLDVVLTEEEACITGNLHIYLTRNDGLGNLQLVAPLTTFVIPHLIAAADLDGDGNLDLISMEGGYGLGVFLGNGDLSFRPEVISGTPGYRFTIDDLDGDGVLDAAITVPADSFGTDQVGFCRGRGDGTFAPAVLYSGSSVLEVLRIAVDLDAADLDCDGDLDLVVTNYASNDLGVFLNRGDGTFAPQVRYGPGLTPFRTVVGDFTGDGTADIASVVWEGPFCCGDAVAVLGGLCGCAVPDVIPPDQGNVLRAVKRGADVVLGWSGTLASRFRLYRDLAKTALGQTARPPDADLPAYLDTGAVGGDPLYFYRIKGLSPCTSTPGL